MCEESSRQKNNGSERREREGGGLQIATRSLVSGTRTHDWSDAVLVMQKCDEGRGEGDVVVCAHFISLSCLMAFSEWSE